MNDERFMQDHQEEICKMDLDELDLADPDVPNSMYEFVAPVLKDEPEEMKDYMGQLMGASLSSSEFANVYSSKAEA